MNLRPYQIQAVDSAFAEWQRVQSTLNVMATGCGKTVVASHTARRMNKPTLMLVHREELLWQGKKKIEQVTGWRVGVEMGDYKAHQDGIFGYQAIVSTVQTQYSGRDGEGRMTLFNPHDFGLLIVDEAHRYVAPKYKEVVDYYKQNPALKVLGLTATPKRADDKAMGQIFESVCMNYGIADATNDGWLAPIRQRMVTVEGLDLSKVRTSMGDLSNSDLSEAISRVVGKIALPTLEIIEDRKTLIFMPNRKTAEAICDFFNAKQEGIARWVSGKTDKLERREILADYAAGKFQILVNVDVLIEGYDHAGIQVVAIPRLTKSEARYIQMLGRGTRPEDGLVDQFPTAEQRIEAIAASSKPYLEVIDYAGNAGRHKLITALDVLGGDYSPAVRARARGKAEGAGQAIDPKAAMEEAKAEIAREKEEAERIRMEKARAVAAVAQKPNYVSLWVDPFSALDIPAPRQSAWTAGRMLSEKQRDMIEKHYGMDPDTLNYAEGKKLVDELFRRWKTGECSPKQANLLKKYGMNIHASRSEAAELIGLIKAGKAKSAPKVEKFVCPGFE